MPSKSKSSFEVSHISDGKINPSFELNEHFGIRGKWAETNGNYDKEFPPRKVENRDATETPLLYGINESPPIVVSIVLGFQHYLEMIAGSIAIPFFLFGPLCMTEFDPDRANIISTMVFNSGLLTILQTVFGTRLPIVQGGSFSYLIPALSILSLPKWKCPSEDIIQNMSSENRTELWQVRMREIQGAIIFAALFESLMGLFGIIGLILRFVTPLTVFPAIFIIGVTLFKSAAIECAKNWYFSCGTTFLLILFSQYLRNYTLPIKIKKKGQQDSQNVFKFPVFQVFPVLLSLIIMCIISTILTYTDVLGENDPARINNKVDLLKNAPWIRIPYPFQWGWPSCSIGAILGMTSGVLASIVESLGDYMVCSKIANVSSPPENAMNRGIFIEGLGCVIGGIWGSGNGSTSYSSNIGTMSITGVASKKVIISSGCIMILLSLIGKAGAIFIAIPDPVIGGIFLYLFPLVMAIGLHILKEIDMTSTRNLFIASFSIFCGLMMSEYMKENPSLIQTGNEVSDSILQILLGTGMFISGFLGFFLDNTIPGTLEERGISKPLKENLISDKTYDLPFGMDFIKKYKIFKYIPISPTYKNGF